MSVIKGFCTKKLRVPIVASVLFIILFAALITYVMLIMQPINNERLRYLAKRSEYLMPLLNYLPVLMLMTLLYFLTGNVVVSTMPAGFIFLFMAYANRMKILLRGDPLLHWDLTLFWELLGIARGLGWRMVFGAVALLIGFVFVMVFLCHKLRSAPMPWQVRLVGVLASTALAVYGNTAFYSNEDIYKSLPVSGSFYNLADIHCSKGNLYCFIYSLNMYRTEPPEGYDPDLVQAAIAGYEEENHTVDTEQRPHIVMVMGEAFSALSESPAIDFEGFVDPLKMFKALGESFISGSIIVPSRGGGTADTEYDVLTACVSRYFRAVPYAYRLIASPIEAFPSLLKDLGYESYALHPGYRWFYNRQNVYRYLGFDHMVFEDSFAREAYRDTYISEEATFDMLLEMMDAHFSENPGVPIFTFCLTIQNHAAYYNRFLPDGTVNFNANVTLSDEETNILSNYFAGITDADEQLARLAAYLEALDEPAILIYFGDHLPALDSEIYDLLIPGADAEDGSFEKETRLNRIPFIIWLNTAAREQAIIDERAESVVMPENMTISSNYLGAYVMEILGYGDISPFFSFANTVREQFPVLMDSFSFTPDGIEAAQAGDADLGALTFYKSWVYYRMMEGK